MELAYLIRPAHSAVSPQSAYSGGEFHLEWAARGRTVTNDSTHDVTRLLQAWCRGDTVALDKLVPLVYDELHRLAHCYMAREWANDTLQTTALVHEAYLRLVDANEIEWKNRVHFFAISANVMRRILVEFARSRGSQKRGGDVRKVSLERAAILPPDPDEDLLALDSALTVLAASDPRKAKVVELRFFGGFTEQEAAEALGVSSDTVLRDWKSAKLWLYREMTRGEER
jgi:RNA polymerase sigma factor (TIGR02999 family)